MISIGLRRHVAGPPRYIRSRPHRVIGLPGWVWSALVAVIALAIVEGLPRSGIVSSFTLVPFSTMVSRAVNLLGQPEFLMSTFLPTVELILITFVVSVVMGVLIAYLLWCSSWWRRGMEPYLNIYYAIPTFALYPILIVALGVGDAPILFLSVLFSIVAVITNALVGFGETPGVVKKLSVSLRLTRYQHFSKVLLPSAIPSIATGARLALVYSIISVLATEFILSTHGLGYYISYAYKNFGITNMYAGILIVCCLALLGNIAISAIVRTVNWRQR